MKYNSIANYWNEYIYTEFLPNDLADCVNYWKFLQSDYIANLNFEFVQSNRCRYANCN